MKNSGIVRLSKGSARFFSGWVAVKPALCPPGSRKGQAWARKRHRFLILLQVILGVNIFTPQTSPGSEHFHFLQSDSSDLVGASHLGVLALDTLLPLSRLAWVASRFNLMSTVFRKTVKLTQPLPPPARLQHLIRIRTSSARVMW